MSVGVEMPSMILNDAPTYRLRVITVILPEGTAGESPWKVPNTAPMANNTTSGESTLLLKTSLKDFMRPLCKSIPAVRDNPIQSLGGKGLLLFDLGDFCALQAQACHQPLLVKEKGIDVRL